MENNIIKLYDTYEEMNKGRKTNGFITKDVDELFTHHGKLGVLQQWKWLLEDLSSREQQLAEKEKKIIELECEKMLNKNKPAFCELSGKNCEVLGKLAEKDKIIKEMDQEIEGRMERIDKLEELYYQESKHNEWLNQQLAEKEKLIEWQKESLESKQVQIDLDRKVIENLNNEISYFSSKFRYNDRFTKTGVWQKDLELYISECIIKRLKNIKKSLRDKVCLMENDEHCYPQKAVRWQDIVAILGQQIKGEE